MPNTIPQPKIDEAGKDGGMAYGGAMALDKTQKTNDTYNDWMKYLAPQTDAQSDTQVKDFDQSQYMVEHQITKQDIVSPQIVEQKTESNLIIGGKTELRAEFNKQTEQIPVIEKPEIQTLPQSEVKPTPSTASPKAEPAGAENQPKGVGQKIKDFGIDFELFNDKVIMPVFKSVQETATSFFDAMKELFVTYVLWKEKKPKTDEEKKKEAAQAANKKSFFDGLRAAMAQSLMSQQKRRAMAPKIQEVNKTIGNSNVNFEGILNENDDIREEVLQMADKANSEKSKEQIAADKRRKMMSATGGSQKKAPGITMSQDLAHNANNAAKLAG